MSMRIFSDLLSSPALAMFQNPHRRPRRDDEGNEEREDHRRPRADRDRSHVGSHESADEGEWQDRRDHRPGREHGGIADLTHCLDRDGMGRVAAVFREPVMTHDVLHHDDGVVDENPDREDQGEESDAVQGEAVEIKDQQGQRQGRGNGDGDDERLAPS